MNKVAIYPGSFDPITSGHLDIIRRSAKLFDKVIVVVMSNYAKINSYTFTTSERVELIRRCTSSIENVSVEQSMGLLADYAASKNASVVIKGLRAVSDFENEFQQALINKRLNPNIDTLFIPADADHMFLSSGMIKQVVQLGGDATPFLPEQITEDIINKLRSN